tara:strand:- start:233 stop:442 length:210 start_codon:yes stop_codon:yes gene_type:complete
MNDFEDLMHSYGLDPSNPDHLDELLYRITDEDLNDYTTDDLELKLSEYVDLNDLCEEGYEGYDEVDWID